MTRLVAMRPEAFAGFFEAAVTSYADDNAKSGRWPKQDALQLARAETSRLLAAGIETPEHQLFEIEDDVTAEIVGFLWFGTLRSGSALTAHVYQIIVKPEHRRKGHAVAALKQAAAIATSQGHTSIALHVFGHNTAAQALYRSLGYEVSSLNMTMPLRRQQDDAQPIAVR